MRNLEFAIALAKSETEEDVIALLQACGYWNNYSMWKSLGGNDNNYSIIGNQQSSPDAAFVEKIINSIDACLNKECLKRGLNPMGPEAPQSMTDALEQFYNIKPGGLKLVSSARRTELAQNIIVAATGQTRGGQINLCIADRGEGQTPKRMPETILSISKSNKLKIPFVQGKFNMGGTGALPFCGGHHLQLIISKRCPEIPNTEIDDTYDKWSVTIVRKEAPREGRKSSMYTYLTDLSGKLLTFETESLPIIPMEHIKGTRGFRYEDMSFGTFIKLYNYQLTGYKSIITRHLYDRLSLLIPNLALPIRFRESRELNANTNAANLAGLISRLYDDRSNVLEEGFPSSSVFVLEGQKITCSIYLFKDKKETNYRGKHEGVLFCVNGQTQGILPDSFFSRANLSYIKNSILVILDCSDIDIEHQEKLFMTSRDRIRSSEYSKTLVSRIEQVLREHPGLKVAANNRRNAALKDMLADNKPMKDILQGILQKSTVLTKLFISGQEISSPYNSTFSAGKGKVFKGKLHPTFFKIKGKLKKGILNKSVPCNASFRVQFDTDVQNDYFNRPAEAGSLVLKMDGVIRADLIQHLSLFNGQANLTIKLPSGASEGDRHVFETEILDDYIVHNFKNTFYVNVIKAEEPRSGGMGKPHSPTDTKIKGDRQSPGGFALPNIIPVERNDWKEYDMDRFSALVYRPTDEGGDYVINMDNDYLLTELKSIREQSQIDLTKARFKYSMTLIGMSVMSYYKHKKANLEEVDIYDEVRRISSMISPVLIPMLESMANLDMDEKANAA